MAEHDASPMDVAVVLPPEATDVDEMCLLARLLASLGHRVTAVAVDGAVAQRRTASSSESHEVELLIAPALELGVAPGFLEVGLRFYRALRGASFDAVVAPARGGHGYCVARARQLGAAFPATPILIHYTGSTLQAALDESRPFLRKSEVGTIATERLSVRIADGIVCESAARWSWLRDAGWALPGAVVPPGPDADSASLWMEALARTGAARTRQPAMATQPRVSVVVSHYERPHLLEQTLQGLASQTRAPQEVVIADDGSRGEDARISLSSIEKRSWPWPLEILRLPHQGVHEARNAGWRSVTGDRVLFVDHDDVPFPTLVEALANAHAASGADVVCAGSHTFTGEGWPEQRSGDVISLWLGQPYEMGLLSNHYGGPTCLWPRSLLDRLAGFRESFQLAEDWDILARASVAGAEIAGTVDPLFWNRQLPTGRLSLGGEAMRRRSLVTVAGYAAAELPTQYSMPPLLAAGAYEEIERRKSRDVSRRVRLARRLRALASRGRDIYRREGTIALLRRAYAYVRRSR